MEIQSDLAVLVLAKNGCPGALLDYFPAYELIIAGERFDSVPVGEWLGFYDWLRAKNGKVIGVRLAPDEGEIPDHILGKLISVDARNSRSLIYIFFEYGEEVDPSISDDCDFGGNMIFEGDRGTVAIKFNFPTARN